MLTSTIAIMEKRASCCPQALIAVSINKILKMAESRKLKKHTPDIRKDSLKDNVWRNRKSYGFIPHDVAQNYHTEQKGITGTSCNKAKIQCMIDNGKNKKSWTCGKNKENQRVCGVPAYH